METENNYINKADYIVKRQKEAQKQRQAELDDLRKKNYEKQIKWESNKRNMDRVTKEKNKQLQEKIFTQTKQVMNKKENNADQLLRVKEKNQIKHYNM